jgi:hypothetical protein
VISNENIFRTYIEERELQLGRGDNKLSLNICALCSHLNFNTYNKMSTVCFLYVNTSWLLVNALHGGNELAAARSEMID